MRRQPAETKLGKFCGPTVVSVFKGVPPDAVAPFRGRAGMATELVRSYFPRSAWKFYAHTERTTLARFCSPGVRGIVLIAGHYIAVDGLLALDTKVDRQTWVFDHPHARAKVRAFLALAPEAR